MGGYVHTAYPPIYEYLARQAGFTSAMFVRGVEGGIIPPYNKLENYSITTLIAH